MAPRGSVSRWIAGIKDGDEEAARALWERYFGQLVQAARHKIAGMPRRVADEEDVALCAFTSFCVAAGKGRFPDLADRQGLWRLLLQITARRAIDLRRYNARGRRRVLGESALALPDAEHPIDGLAEVVGESPTPAFAAMVAEECRRLLDRLNDENLEAVAIGKMEGYTNAELAARFDCSARTIERQLRLIRAMWKSESE